MQLQRAPIRRGAPVTLTSSSVLSGHFRRSNYSERPLRPAADGWYPPHGEKSRTSVLVCAEGEFPGRPLPPWPPVEPGALFVTPTRRDLPAKPLTCENSCGAEGI
jgi:hypothetical protein